jgi:hypothetical protein
MQNYKLILGHSIGENLGDIEDLEMIFLVNTKTMIHKEKKLRAGGAAQVVECLSNTCEALSSSSNTTKKMIN